MASEPSSTDACKCHHERRFHEAAGCVACRMAGIDILSNHGFIESEPKGSASSSSDFVRCRCDHFQLNHRPFTEGGCRNCACQTFRLVPQVSDCPRTHPESGLRCTKDRAYFHMEHVNGDTVWDDRDEPEAPADDAHDFAGPSHCAACMKSWLPPDSVPGSEVECGSVRVNGKHEYEYQTDGVFKCACGAVSLMTESGAEPPLTPEEEEEIIAKSDGRPQCDVCGKYAHSFEDCPEGMEEQAPEDEEPLTDEFGQPVRECWSCERVGCKGCPPQPEWSHAAHEGARGETAGDRSRSDAVPIRRPPSLVAYSVQGHLYEVAVSGDATVQAVDGALVITHALGPVAGIVQIMPAPKEGPDGSA